MGDPRKIRKKYKSCKHPWQRVRIDEERIIKKEYGLKNKKEILKAESILRRLNVQAKKLIREKSKGSKQAFIEESQLISSLCKFGFVNDGSKLDDILALELKNILNRRLQTLIFKSGLSLTPKQARQLIVHGHVLLNGRKVSVPSYIVTKDEELTILFNPSSSFASKDHPEIVKRTHIKEAAEKKMKAGKTAVEETLDNLTEEKLEKIEKEVGVVEI